MTPEQEQITNLQIKLRRINKDAEELSNMLYEYISNQKDIRNPNEPGVALHERNVRRLHS